MLNIGVGGALLEDLAVEKGVDVHVLDPNERSISKVRDLHNLGNKAQTGYSNNIPFDNEAFDNVVMSEVLEHLDTEVLEKTITEVARVLKPNGAFLITVPFEEDLADGLVVCPHCGDKFHRWGHQQTFSMSRLRQLLEAEGFLVEKMQARCFPDWSRKGLTNKMKSGIRYVLGRLQVNIAQPSIFVQAVLK
jgi:2-polyprenyl-3-methyl-5-hydroxy-6-metoxy-1,4-benzoquinol methylase